GDFRHSAPRAWQESRGIRRPVPAEFTIAPSGEVGFAVRNYDPRLELVIDPVINYFGYTGGGALDTATGVATDAAGNVYVTGSTTSLDFPLHGTPFRDFNNGLRDGFVMKLTPGSQFPIWATYLGGNGNDEVNAIAVDPIGQSYLVGTTFSTNFPLSDTPVK